MNIEGIAFYPVCLHQEIKTWVYMNEEQFCYFNKRIEKIGENNYISINVSLSENEFEIIKKYNPQI